MCITNCQRCSRGNQTIAQGRQNQESLCSTLSHTSIVITPLAFDYLCRLMRCLRALDTRGCRYPERATSYCSSVMALAISGSRALRRHSSIGIPTHPHLTYTKICIWIYGAVGGPREIGDQTWVVFWAGWSRGGTGRSPSTSVAGFTGKRQKWLRSGGARRVPGMPKTHPRVAKWICVRPRCPPRIPMARGGVAVAIGNHLFLVAATKMAFTGSWNAHGAC